MAVLTALLFVVLTPGILLTLPSKASSKLVIAIVHGVIFALVYHFIHTAVCEWTRNYEGFQAKKAVKKVVKKPATKPVTKPVKKPVKARALGCTTQLIQSATAAKVAKHSARVTEDAAYTAKKSAERALIAAKTACKKEPNCLSNKRLCNF